MKHTPGPWIAEGRFVYTSPTDAESCEMIARVGVMESKRNEVDAKLIAAAPELLSELQQVEAILCSDFPDDLETCQNIIRRAKSAIGPAIAKATE